MKILILFVRMTNLNAFKEGQDVVEVATDPPLEPHVVVQKVRFDSCPTCGGSGYCDKIDMVGVTSWGPCPECKRSLKINT